MKVVLDTNVLASAVATRGLCADILRAVLAEHEVVICRQITEELRRVLIDKFGVSHGLVSEVLWLLRQDATTVRPRTAPNVTLEDEEDLGILAAAVAAEADVLVTGDKALQDLRQVERTAIQSPRASWEQLAAQPGESGMRGRPRR